MRRFGWTRLAGLLLVLTVLVALVRMGDGAEARSLAARVPDGLIFSGWTEDPVAKPNATRLTEGLTARDLASLEDMRARPRPTQAPTRPAASPASPEPAEAAPDRAAGAGSREVSADLDAPRAVPAAEPREISAGEPPVFYRPAAATGSGSGPVCGDLRGAPKGGRIVFPLQRQFFYSYEDTWGAARTQGGHEGTDLMTPSGVPEYAVTDGTVVPVAGSDADGWNSLGGNAVMIRADYSIGPVKAGDLFYYAHLREKSPLAIGTRVTAGQVVGYAGDTGQGPPGTRGLFPPHLHLGWYDGTGDRQQADSGAMNPYPLLEWIRSHGGAVTGGSDARFCEAPRTGPPTPASTAGPWPAPPSPGLTPDLDTGSGNPLPLPTTQQTPNENPPTAKPPTAKPPTAKPPTAKPPAPKPTRPDRPQATPAADQSQKPDPPKEPPRPPAPPAAGAQQPPPSPPPANNPPKPTPPKPPPPGSTPPTPQPAPQEPDPPTPAPDPSGPPVQYNSSTGETPDPPAPDQTSEEDRKPVADKTADGAPSPGTPDPHKKASPKASG